LADETQSRTIPLRLFPKPTRGVVVRAYSPRGFYWKRSVALRDALYVDQGDLVFTACKYDESWRDTSDFYSELDLLKIEEVRFLSSLALPIEVDQGMVLFHPMPHEVLLASPLELDAAGAQEIIGEALRQRLREDASKIDDYLALPPLLDDRRAYEYRHSSLPTSMQLKLFEAIDVADHLLIRGLYGLLRCSMLMNYPMFLEEAALALYVSLDASFTLVRRSMVKQGHLDPSARDAGAWIASAFKEEHFNTRYFENYYDDRIRMNHADSRFGIFPFGPLSVDDCYYLLKNLRDVYRFLILGEVVAVT
jgi:hypothetical protein